MEEGAHVVSAPTRDGRRRWGRCFLLTPLFSQFSFSKYTSLFHAQDWASASRSSDAVTLLQREEKATSAARWAWAGGAVPPGTCVCEATFRHRPAQGPAAATPLVGPESARAEIRPFLLPRQGQAALTSSPSLPVSHPHPLQPRRPAAAPRHTPTAPALSLHLTSFPVTAPSSDAFSVPSQGPKEALFPTVRFPGDICASLQASSRASLPSSLELGEPNIGPGPAVDQVPCLPGSGSARFTEASPRSSSKLCPLLPPHLSPRWYLPSQLFCLHFLI